MVQIRHGGAFVAQAGQLGLEKRLDNRGLAQRILFADQTVCRLTRGRQNLVITRRLRATARAFQIDRRVGRCENDGCNPVVCETTVNPVQSSPC